MRIGAWFDVEEDALRIRSRGATRAESRRALAHLARFLQSLALPTLQLMGEALQATLEDAGCGENAVRVARPGAPDKEPEWPAQPGASDPPLVILVADPDPAMRRFYWDAYSRSRHDLVVAEGLSQSMQRYRSLRPDVLISGVGSADLGAAADLPEGVVPRCPPRHRRPAPWPANPPAPLGTLNHRRSEPPRREFMQREAKIGAWYDAVADELHLRMWGAKNGEFRRALAHLARAIQSIDLPELRAIGKAIEATLEEEERGAAPDDYGIPSPFRNRLFVVEVMLDAWPCSQRP